MKKLLKKIAKVAAGAGKAVLHGLLPVDDVRRVLRDPDRKAAAERIRSYLSVNGEQKIYEDPKTLRLVADLLDDGRINDSVSDVRLETITRLIVSASGLIGLIIYLVSEWL